MRSIDASKDKVFSKLEKQKNGLEEQVLLAKVETHEAVTVATYDTKVCVARTVLQTRIKMAYEAIDPDFDRSAWDVASWKQTLLRLGGEEELATEKEVASGAGGDAAAEAATVAMKDNYA
ncbi:hypothetical protein Hanom_Chr04g00326631 [Helianthus anomalus]